MVQLRAIDGEETILEKLSAFPDKNDADAELFHRTLSEVHKSIKGGAGGTMVAVVHENLLLDRERTGGLNCDCLDNGIQTELFREIVKNIHDEPDKFKVLMEALTAHNETDRWKNDELTELIRKLPEVEVYADKLRGQPKDGALLISHKGNIKGVALHLKHSSFKFQLMRKDGKAAGTRHASGLGFTEWLGDREPSAGVLFARSDGGGAHLFIPHKEKPEILSFQTLELPTQRWMVKQFKRRVVERGVVYEKVQPVLVRPAKPGERVITMLDGRVTADKTIDQDEREPYVVIRSPNAEQEEYVLPKSRCDEIYQPGIALDEVPPEYWPHPLFLPQNLNDLMSMGFQVRKPIGMECRYVYTFTDEDAKSMPPGTSGRFLTTFKEIQQVKEGISVAMDWPASKGNSMYRISKHTLKSMRQLPPAERVPKADARERQLQVERAAAVDQFHEAIDKANVQYLEDNLPKMRKTWYDVEKACWQRVCNAELAKQAEFLIKSHSAPKDATSEFEGLVTSAMQHFKTNPEDRRVVRILSKAQNKWYVNSLAKLDIFDLVEAPDQNSASQH